MIVPRGQRYQWTPEMIARLGADRDEVIARELGMPVTAVRYQRLKRGIPQYLQARHMPPDLRARRDLYVTLDEALAAKLNELGPMLMSRYRDAGLPIRALDHAQIIEIAVNELLSSERRRKTRGAYRGAT